MPDVESLIAGSEKLTSIFGRWPSFHDAEVLELHFSPRGVQPEVGGDGSPVVTAKIHVWEMTQEVDWRGYFVGRHHTLATLRFHGVDEFSMEDFNQQNVIFELRITAKQDESGSSHRFVVDFDPAFGMGALFECIRIEVVDAVPCTEDGEASG
jgi:hypothetical protein